MPDDQLSGLLSEYVTRTEDKSPLLFVSGETYVFRGKVATGEAAAVEYVRGLLKSLPRKRMRKPRPK